MVNVKILLGKRIRELRKKRNLTQEQLAELIGIEIPSLSNIENGKNYPNSETIDKIARGLQVQIFEIYMFEHLEEFNREEMLRQLINMVENDFNLLKIIYKIAFNLKKTN